MALFGLFKPDVHKLEEKRDVRGLLKTLRYKSDEFIREKAAWALVTVLSENPDRTATEPLIAALQDSNVCVRRRAAIALRDFPSDRVVDVLIQALGNERCLECQEEIVIAPARSAIVGLWNHC